MMNRTNRITIGLLALFVVSIWLPPLLAVSGSHDDEQVDTVELSVLVNSVDLSVYNTSADLGMVMTISSNVPATADDLYYIDGPGGFIPNGTMVFVNSQIQYGDTTLQGAFSLDTAAWISGSYSFLLVFTPNCYQTDQSIVYPLTAQGSFTLTTLVLANKAPTPGQQATAPETACFETLTDVNSGTTLSDISISGDQMKIGTTVSTEISGETTVTSDLSLSNIPFFYFLLPIILVSVIPKLLKNKTSP
ncbi:MAG: hypothetical protein IH840_09235 [Candidatus Heimdallarchaeota archaeon]|nr:hypothetical protein [Candidatus Heimdallarchaeota archaeon]